MERRKTHWKKIELFSREYCAPCRKTKVCGVAAISNKRLREKSMGGKTGSCAIIELFKMKQNEGTTVVMTIEWACGM